MLMLPLGLPPRPAAIAVGVHGPGLLRYRLSGLWQLHLYPYACRAVIGGRALDIRPGSIGLTAPDEDMRYDLPRQSTHTYVHFAAAGDAVPVPALIDAASAFPAIEADLRAAAGWEARDSGRAAARLWDALWTVVRLAPAPRRDPVVEQACDAIEARLAARPPIAALARRLGLSHSQLDRRFRAALGVTVVGYARRRRAALAEHLLRSSDLPAAAIAARVGAGDLQALNKLLRQQLGRGPRAIRGG